MIREAIIRGVVAGLIVGVLAGLFALVLAEPSVDAAIALEEAAAEAATAEAATAAHMDGLSRGAQKVGLVIGMTLYGPAIGAVFGVASAWARGRISGDTWTRTLKLAAGAVVALVLLPSLAYPPNPPAVGDPTTVGDRTAIYLGLWVFGVLLLLFAWTTTRALVDRSWSRPAAQTLAGAIALAIACVMLALLPDPPGAAGFPADLLWSFRLWSIATQVLLFGGTAIAYGVLSQRAGRTLSKAPDAATNA